MMVLFKFQSKVKTCNLIKTHSMSLIYKTTHTDVYKGSGVVLKKYREKTARDIYINERDNMGIIDPVRTSTPELIDFNDSEMFLLMKDVGTDGIDLMNSYQMGRSTWELFYMQLYKALNELHAQGIVHRDLKPENTTFKNGKWHLIDLAFAENKEKPVNAKLVGTYPYTAPMTGNAQILHLFLKHNDRSKVKLANDYFAFALSVITMAVDIREVRTSKLVSINIEPIHILATGDCPFAPEVLSACAMIVLACTDIGYKTITWAGGSCTFSEPIDTTIVTEEMVERNISFSWARLGSIIEKQIGCGNDSNVQTENKHEESC